MQTREFYCMSFFFKKKRKAKLEVNLKLALMEQLNNNTQRHLKINKRIPIVTVHKEKDITLIVKDKINQVQSTDHTYFNREKIAFGSGLSFGSDSQLLFLLS